MFRSPLGNSTRLHYSAVIHVHRSGFLSFCTKTAENEVNEVPQQNASISAHAVQIPAASSFGQPTPFTHPHLLKPGELLPGIKTEEFTERRKKLMKLLSIDSQTTYGQDKHHVVIIPAATKTYMTENIPYIFRQNSNFLYLSGCLEPDTALVLTGSSGENFTSTLFLRKQTAHSALWDGSRTGTDIAPEMFGVDQAFYVEDLREFISQSFDKNPDSLIYYDSNNPPAIPLHRTLNGLFQIDKFKVHQTAKFFLHKLRLVKSSAEQNLMRKAGEISSEAIKQAMKVTKPGITEHHLFSVVDHESRMRGAEILAYPPVVAAGNNATIIHYINNNQLIKDGDLILMDAGCEYHGYCGDITRTWPANGKFTNHQRILYEIVLEVQKQILALCKERMSLDFMYFRMINLLGKYLSSEKIIKKDFITTSEINKIASDLCPHRVSHYLGMDVHDSPDCAKNLPLLPGTIVTVEPGLYVHEHNNDVPREFWKTGIRIEDDVLITETGYEVLSAKCPKEITDIESLMSKS